MLFRSKQVIFFLLSCIAIQAHGQELSKQYDKIGKFKNGIAVVWKNGHCGLISQGGKEIVKPQYDKIGAFGNDAIAYTEKDGKMGMINMEGKVVVPNIYEEISGFKGFYAITRRNGLAGMINKQGKVLVKNEYEKIKIGKNGEIRAVKNGQEMVLDLQNR